MKNNNNYTGVQFKVFVAEKEMRIQEFIDAKLMNNYKFLYVERFRTDTLERAKREFDKLSKQHISTVLVADFGIYAGRTKHSLQGGIVLAESNDGKVITAPYDYTIVTRNNTARYCFESGKDIYQEELIDAIDNLIKSNIGRVLVYRSFDKSDLHLVINSKHLSTKSIHQFRDQWAIEVK